MEGKLVSDILKVAEAAYAGSGMLAGPQERSPSTAASMAGSGRRSGIDFLDGKDHPVHLDLTAKEPIGVPAEFGHLSTFYVQFTARRVEGSVGYVSLNIFFDAVNVMKKFGEAIEANRDADGMIIDLRGNPGGIGMMSFAIADGFVTEPGLKLGTIDRARHDELPAEPPRAPLREAGRGAGGRAVDVDLGDPGRRPPGTSKRAEMVGTKTPGAALPSMVELLPNGDRFQFAIANYIPAGGKPLEGDRRGARRRDPVDAGRAARRPGPAVEAAARWIRSLKAKS